MGPDASLYYMRNRWYEAGVGRFLSEDPTGLEGGLNPVSYAGNDPVNLRDPSGHFCEGIWYLGDASMTGGMDEIVVNAPRARFLGWSCTSSEPPTMAGGSFAGPTVLGVGGMAIRDWSRLEAHVVPDHVLGRRGWGSLFTNMDDATLRYVVKQTALKGKVVAVQKVGEEVRYVIDRNWKTPIGTKGQTVARVVVSSEGRLVTSFPRANILGTIGRAAGATAGFVLGLVFATPLHD